MSKLKQFEGLIMHLSRTAAGLGLGIYGIHVAVDIAKLRAKTAVDVANVYAKNG